MKKDQPDITHIRQAMHPDTGCFLAAAAVLCTLIICLFLPAIIRAWNAQ